APMIAAFWFASTGRWKWYAACLAFVLLTREDFALTVAMLGIVLALFRGQRRAGAITLVTAVLWFLLATQVIMPWRNDGRSGFYSGYFAKLGETPSEIAFNTVRHPSRVLDTARTPEKQTYYRQMLAPTAGLPFLAPSTLLVAAPSVFINTMAEGVDAANIRYQYSTMTTAVLFVATVDGLTKLRRRRGLTRFALSGLMVCAVASNVAWAPSPIGIAANRGIWSLPNDARAEVVRRAIDTIPDDEGVASTYALVPHVTHRVTSYLWPTPFDYQNWGFADESTGRPDLVEWLLIDRRTLGESQPIFDQLTAPGGEFEIVFDEDDVVVAHRVKPPATMEPIR
ncbi:MAG TPA: DUF2079 domain-containing protein, partial [Microthrixaceae bacterium]|nr:DUF2079 domain-containing protein [Microthrixaceae bacterium]